MKKPEHQWETPLHRAVRLREVPGAFADDPRAEAFELRFNDGRVGHATLGVARQQLDAVAATDPDVAFAVRCWLAARGQRSIALEGPDGPLDAASFEIRDLDTLQDCAVGPIISLAPSNADVVVALGQLHRLVACEDSSEIPPDAREGIERLGPDLGPDLERIATLRPSVVLSSLTVPGMERVVTGLRTRGVPQVVLAPRRIEDVRGELQRVGAALGCVAEAQTVVAGFDAERRELEAKARSNPAAVYLEWWPKPMFTPGADCFSNELIALAGGRNVFGDRPGSSLQITAEELVSADPEICFVSWCGVEEAKLDPTRLIQRPGLESLAAARQGRVFALDERFSGRPGPRMLEASRRMAAALAGE